MHGQESPRVLSREEDQIYASDHERGASLVHHLTNDVVQHFSWSDVGVKVKNRKTGQPISILDSSYGYIEAGDVLALMGPSGSGKTTLLNTIAHRMSGPKVDVHGMIMVNGQEVSRTRLQQLSSYVEQEDALIGSLTVAETINFAARLALGGELSPRERKKRVEDLVESFGLQVQAGTIVGTPLQKGISGGQKRRLSVASQLVTSPRILFLDEPTSGLDSAASREVMGFIAEVARLHQMIVIASIHQPSTTTFELFDRILLLSTGRTCFFGKPSEASGYFSNINHPMPLHTNPAEFMLDLINTDFAKDRPLADKALASIQEAWSSSAERETILQTITASSTTNPDLNSAHHSSRTNFATTTLTLLHRNFVKSHRDLLVYGTRIAMYLGLAIMMGTVWLRLPYMQNSIQPFINAIFFGGAFMSFMAVAYVPAIIEDIHTFRKERANGLYGPLPFTIANFVIGVPYLFLIALLFSIVTYWLTNFRHGAVAFWYYVLWLFLDLLAAEALVVLVTCVAPIFVVCYRTFHST